MSIAGKTDCVLHTEREFPYRVRQVFSAFEQRDRLAQWWGPDGFRNTFDRFEFKPGGQWDFVMHGPNGVDYPNQSVFKEIVSDAKIVIEHVSQPRFTLTVTFTDRVGKTHLTWTQEFESPDVAAKLRAVCEPANEQNLDRLQSVLFSNQT